MFAYLGRPEDNALDAALFGHTLVRADYFQTAHRAASSFSSLTEGLPALVAQASIQHGPELAVRICRA